MLEGQPSEYEGTPVTRRADRLESMQVVPVADTKR